MTPTSKESESEQVLGELGQAMDDVLERLRGRGTKARGGGGEPGQAKDAAGGKGPKVVIVVERESGNIRLKGFPPTIEVDVPWDKMFAAIERAIEAKKEKDILGATAEAWERIGAAKDLLIKALYESLDGKIPKEKIIDFYNELQPKLSQLQNVANSVRRALEKGDKDEARQHLKNLKQLLEKLREWLKAQGHP